MSDTVYGNMFKYELGQSSKDEVTLLTGILTARYYHMNGCKFYLLQPPVKEDNSFRDSSWVAEFNVIADKLEEKTTMFEIKMRSEVKSDVTNFKGIVVARAEHYRSVNRYYVQPPVNKEDKLQDGMWIDESELVVLSSPKEVEKPKGSGPDPGGFPSRIM